MASVESINSPYGAINNPCGAKSEFTTSETLRLLCPQALASNERIVEVIVSRRNGLSQSGSALMTIEVSLGSDVRRQGEPAASGWYAGPSLKDGPREGIDQESALAKRLFHSLGVFSWAYLRDHVFTFVPLSGVFSWTHKHNQVRPLPRRHFPSNALSDCFAEMIDTNLLLIVVIVDFVKAGLLPSGERRAMGKPPLAGRVPGFEQTDSMLAHENPRRSSTVPGTHVESLHKRIVYLGLSRNTQGGRVKLLGRYSTTPRTLVKRLLERSVYPGSRRKKADE